MAAGSRPLAAGAGASEAGAAVTAGALAGAVAGCANLPTYSILELSRSAFRSFCTASARRWFSRKASMAGRAWASSTGCAREPTR